MSQYNEGKKAFTAGGTIARFATVKLSSSSGTVVEACGSNESNIGFAADAAVSGETLTVFLKNAGGTFRGLAYAAISAGDTLYNAASGRLVNTGGDARYVALEAATAQDDVIEVMPNGTY